MIFNICFSQSLKVSPNTTETKKDLEDTVGSLKCVYVWVYGLNWIWICFCFFVCVCMYTCAHVSIFSNLLVLLDWR